MYWTLELASKLEDAPWPATKDELIDYAVRSGAPDEVIQNLQEIEDEGDVYGPTIRRRKIFFGTRMNISRRATYREKLTDLLIAPDFFAVSDVQ